MDLISQLRYQAQRDADAANAESLESVSSAESVDPLARFRLDGKVAVITGGAGGIGRQVALELAAVGATVVIADRDGADLDGAARGVTDRVDATVATATVDVASKAAIDALAAQVVADHGSIDVWVNAAGVLRYQPLVETEQEHFDTVVGVNLQGVLWGTAAAGRQMAKQGSGSIVNIASAGGDMPSPNIAIYGLTKAAVIHLTKTAASELGAAGVRVNAVAPGFIETPMVSIHWTDSAGHVDEEARRHMLSIRAAQSPLNLTGEPRDIADAVLYLATDAARFVTGQVMRPNGGVVMP